MRIIGGKDFYDGGLAMGRDEDVVFVRGKHSEAEVVKPDGIGLGHPVELIGMKDVDRKSSRAFGNPWGHHNNNEVMRHDCRYQFTTACAWFAGKRYGGIRVHKRFTDYGKPSEDQWFWDRQAFLNFLGTIGVEMRAPSAVSSYYIDEKGLEAHFEGRGTASEQKWAIENGVAVAIWIDDYGQKGWKLNTDGLKGIDFVRVIDTYAAFQELSMFVGGVMARPGNPMVEITDDKVKAAKHGFNDWSFRKMPGM